MTERHPDWFERTEFWRVHDIDFATPDVTLPQIEEQILALVVRLGGPVTSPPPAPLLPPAVDALHADRRGSTAGSR